MRKQLLPRSSSARSQWPNGLGGEHELKIMTGYPTTINNPEQAKFMREIAEQMLGAGKVQAKPALHMGAEDFSFMARQAPGARSCF